MRPEMHELLTLLKDKYRIFLITQVPEENGTVHKKAQAELQKLIDSGCALEHRVMYCTTEKGKEALVRQLSAELHLDTDF